MKWRRPIMVNLIFGRAISQAATTAPAMPMIRWMFCIMVLTLIALPVRAGYIPQADLIAHWAFEGNGLDSSGNANHTSHTGSVSYTAGRFGGQAVDLNGASYLSGSAANLHYGSGPFSIAFWMQSHQPDSDPNFHFMSYGKWANGQYVGPRIYGNAAGDEYILSYMGYDASPSAVYDFNTDYPVPLNTWEHYAFTYDGTTMKIYVNGTLHDSETMALNISPERYLVIGGRLTNPGSHTVQQYFDGLMDDLAIWSTELSADQVRAIAQNNDPAAIPAPLAIVGVFPLLCLPFVRCRQGTSS